MGTSDDAMLQTVPDDVTTRSVDLPEGRTIGLADGGDPSGYPVVGLDGTRGCMLSRRIEDSVFVEAGVRSELPRSASVRVGGAAGRSALDHFTLTAGPQVRLKA